MHITKDNYVTIQGFMALPTENGGLGLSGNELIVYAVLYGFSQDGKSWFEGTQEYLATWCGGTTRTVRNVVNSLIGKGFVEKREKKIKNIVFYDYRVINVPTFRGAEKFSSVAEKSSHHIYRDNNTPSDIDSNESISSPPKGKRKRESFVKPTISEIQAYCAEKGYHIDAERFWHHYESNGWLVGKVPMKSWRSALVTWKKNQTADEPKKGLREG